MSCIVCAPCVFNGHRGQKKVSENHHAGTGIPSQVLCKNSQRSSLLSSLQPWQPFVFNSEWSLPKSHLSFLSICVCVWCRSVCLHQVDVGPCGGGKLCWIPTGVMQSWEPPARRCWDWACVLCKCSECFAPPSHLQPRTYASQPGSLRLTLAFL